MRSFHFLFFITSLLSFTSALFYKDVTEKNFDKLIDPSKASILLEFYAPWCGHCKSLAPEYEKLGETFEHSKDVIIAQVDADKHKALGSRFKVKGFPTLKWIQKGSSLASAEDVQAGRTAEDLLAFVNGKVGMSKRLKSSPPSDVIDLTSASFKSIVMKESTAALVGFFAPWCGHCKAIKPTWEKLAHLYGEDEDVVIGAVNCDDHQDLAIAYDVKGFPTLKFFGADGIPESYEGPRELEDMVAFVNEKTGLDIAVDGGVVEEAGVVAELTDDVKSFVSAKTAEERSEVVETCRVKVEGLDEMAKRNFELYVKIFEKIGERGGEYIGKERMRLAKMLERPESLKKGQMRNFMRKVNILSLLQELL